MPRRFSPVGSRMVIASKWMSMQTRRLWSDTKQHQQPRRLNLPVPASDPLRQEFQTAVARHAIAPARVIRGEHAWREALQPVAALCQRPALLGRSPATHSLRTELSQDLTSIGLEVSALTLVHDCCEDDLQSLAHQIVSNNCDAVIAAGGGKVLDAGKLLAYRLGLTCITVPLSSSTCAG